MDTGKVTAAPARMPPVRTRLPGNQALLRLQRKCACGGEETCSSCQIQTRRIQTKVVVGTVDDPLEMEADAVADRVMRMPETNPVKPSSAGLQIQRACAACEHEEEDVVRRKAKGSNAYQFCDSHAPKSDTPVLSDSNLTQGGAPLPGTVREFFEQRFGRDLSSVRVHTDTDSHRANVDLHSHAFTYGEHIWLARGESAVSNQLMAHEMAHVIQQRAPRLLTPQPRDGAGRSDGLPSTNTL